MIDELLTQLRLKSEGVDIDFKSTQYQFAGANDIQKGELLKDILAMANAWRDGPGYILLGFKERRPHPAETVGILESIDDASMQQFVHAKIFPKITFHYEEHLYEGMKIGIIKIPKQKRTFYLLNDFGKLKKNVVYVRRGSCTDEAGPPEIASMTHTDAGRGDMRVELSVLALDNNELPDTFARRYFQFIEELPDFKGYRQPSSRFEIVVPEIGQHENVDFFREYAEFVRTDEALIVMQFMLHNRSSTQLSNAKLEVTVDPLDGQKVKMLNAEDVPKKPKSHYSLFTDRLPALPEILAKQSIKFHIDNGGDKPIVHIRFGSLLPGEQGRSDSKLALALSGPGKLRLQFRILASELAEPKESERIIETTGLIEEFDFEKLKAYVRERVSRDGAMQ